MRLLALGLSDGVTRLYDSATGEVHNVDRLPELVANGEPGVLAGSRLYLAVAELHKYFREFDSWTLQIRGIERNTMRRDETVRVGSFLPLYFGFSSSGRHRGNTNGVHRSRAKARLFQCMDLENLCDLKTVELTDCIAYAQSILNLCEQRGVRFSGSRGGLAARLLKASPEWEKGRPAAPEFINQLGRLHLPGNYYGLGDDVRGRTYEWALYLDQQSAHHRVAATTPIPHPAHLHARGNHRLAEQGIRRPWVDGAKMDQVFSQYGLIACAISVKHIPQKMVHLFPPFMHEPGRKMVFLHHNERHYLDGKFATLEYIIAAWTSAVPDPAIPEYAEWAMKAREEGPGRKALLLAAYGALAQRTDRKSTVYLPYRGLGDAAELPRAGTVREVVRERRENTPQPSIVNVIARGVIEAETRARSLALARTLTDKYKAEVLSVYVDGLIVRLDQLPILPPGWCVESELSNLSFQHPTAFTSAQMVKQPGIPRDTPGRAAARMMAASAGAAHSAVKPAMLSAQSE